MNFGPPESYWISSTDAATHPALESDLEVDVAVVGGGIAGLCTAWELARAGNSVAVLEANRIAAGVTGHTTAKLTAQHALIYAHLSRAFGAEAARLYGASQSEAVEHAFAIADELAIDCDLERVPAYAYTESEEGVEEIRAEVEAAQEAGLAASFVTETGLPYPVVGAIRLEDQAQFHPRRYLLALADDLVVNGGRIFEHSRVVDFHLDEVPVVLTTEGGAEMRASDVVVATHYPVLNRLRLFPRLSPRREVVVAAPIAVEEDPAGMYITHEGGTRSVRTAPYRDGKRLLIVTGEVFTPGDADVMSRFERLGEWAAERFGVAALAYHWAAQDNDTTDGLPFIGRVPGEKTHVYVATGFGGWGMSSGILSGSLIAALVVGERPEWTDLYDPSRHHLAKEAPKFASFQKGVAKHYVGDRFARHSRAETPDDLRPGEGAIMKLDDRLRAVYRDEDGVVHMLSPSCSHMGCVVGFNNAERSWDCPCHGSRFNIDGTVISGPATSPLQHRAPPGREVG